MLYKTAFSLRLAQHLWVPVAVAFSLVIIVSRKESRVKNGVLGAQVTEWYRRRRNVSCTEKSGERAAFVHHVHPSLLRRLELTTKLSRSRKGGSADRQSDASKRPNPKSGEFKVCTHSACALVVMP